ncbi:MAG: phosphotransferase, partial [Nocardiopsaceae bacterium]|nr:phosphotransferase [Nocardiopsaceae bacterium]
MTGSSIAIDAVLQAQPPAFTPEQACEIGRATFGIQASGARSLGSERDQAFMLTASSGSGPSEAAVAVLKVSNPAEDPAMLDMEALAAQHAAQCDPGLTIALPRRRPTAASADTRSRRGLQAADLAEFRVRWVHGGAGHWVRAYDVLPGRIRLDPLTLPDPALIAWGETTARLGVALRSFIHPHAIRRLPWDVQHAQRVRPMTASIADPDARATVNIVLDRYDAAVAPRWGHLRAQVIHTDLTADNVLADDDGMITGIVDF